jgi:hypothetical protein
LNRRISLSVFRIKQGMFEKTMIAFINDVERSF